MKRWRKIALATLIIFPLVFFRDNLIDYLADTERSGPAEGSLDCSALGAAPLEFDVGNFKVVIDPLTAHVTAALKNPAGDLAGAEDLRSRILFENEPGHTLLIASSGTGRVTEARGMFRMHERPWLHYSNFSVDKVEIEAPGTRDHTVWLRGKLSTLHGYAYRNAGIGFRAAGDDTLGVITSGDFEVQSGSLSIVARSRPEEHFFGFGEQFTKFDLKGERVPVLVSEGGIGRGLQPLTFVANLLAGAGGDWSTSYRPLSECVTSDLRHFLWGGERYEACDLRDPNRAAFKTFANYNQLQVRAASTPSDLLPRKWRSTTKFPEWVYRGAIIGMQGGTARVREVYERLKQYGVPVAAFWLQDWCGQRKTSFGKQLWWNWELDQERYPQWDELREELRRDDVRIMTYVNPFLVDMQGKRPVKRNLFHEARENGFLVTKRGGTPYLIPNTDFSAGLVDLQNPQAREWMVSVLRQQVLGVGASGWMADFGESYPWDAANPDSDALHTGGMHHNDFPTYWAEVNAEVCSGSNEDLVYFMRSGDPRITPLFWEGDQMVTWDEHDGMKSAVTGLLSSGLCGMVFNHSDIGGYTTITNPIRDYHRSKELLMRWMELNAFSVVFRTHEGNDPEKNAQFYTDDETMAQFARCAKIFSAWLPYRKQLVKEGMEQGLPVVRHPWIHYWNDPEVRKIAYQQFMVGSEFMAAPVLDPGVSKVRVYLPKGRWHHVWTDKVYGNDDAGTYIEVAAPMGYPAMFFKDASAAGEAFRAALANEGLLAGYAGE